MGEMKIFLATIVIGNEEHAVKIGVPMRATTGQARAVAKIEFENNGLVVANIKSIVLYRD